MALQIYLIRHGRTEWNVAGLLQGSGDSPLVEEGIENAKLTGKALADIEFSACYSSLLKRTHDTAGYIIGERDIPHFHHKGLNELHFGVWEGQRSADLAEHPDYILLRTQPERYKAESSQGELIEDFYHRVMKAFQQIVDRHQDGENILIVSHGMTLTLLTAVLKGLPWQQFRNTELHSFVLNTAINVVKVENSKAELVEFNNVEHLVK
ncbi:histidine phosphatase family protein [Muribacter muris]|uniref:phosphoglycerate mutase (2,3-diphosphoglycerate-dependent) n=1 Tax=Muribacter muris TaxID=67855 RepID=A0A4Y9JU45_9PAST|nr:histidine phosphatase family protein [Muribacter muris]MBF0785668.1 histidine phosphatase family protein [Muribacter muris]MBF0828339.1 histidine phosphatase family protein [Muribacter muris]TFV08842.1 histidine phosphatase family protein [Muribacter muris]